jgi:hypothetical protein
MARQIPTNLANLADAFSAGTQAQLQTAGVSNQNIFAQQVQIEARRIAEALLRENSDALRRIDSGRVFTRFNAAEDIVANQKKTVTAGVWSNGIGTLTGFFTSSAQTAAQKEYYYEVFNSASSAVGAEAQFSVVYGNALGSGSFSPGSVDDSSTRAIYSQYKMLLLEPTDTRFTVNGVDQNDIYAINFNRARLKEKLDPGNWQLNLAQLSGSAFANNVHTGSNVRVSGSNRVISLIDDSGDTLQTGAIASIGNSGRVFRAVSGSIENGVHNSTNPHIYGLVYPDMGVIVLSAVTLNLSASFNTVTGSDIAGDNAFKLFTSISGAAAINSANGFAARNSQEITSTHYFVRVKNGEYNFSNNPSFVTGTVGEFRQATFVNDPKAYITTVGLYNDRQELLAVAKLSKPLLKAFDKEILIKCKLDF